MSKQSLHLESIGGASGDMILGALVGLGVSVEELNDELKSLNVDPFEIVVNKLVEQGMSGVRGRVTLHEHHPHDKDASDDPAHHHEHHEPDHSHAHPHEKVHTDGAGHHHDHGRHLSTIQKLIGASALPAAVKKRALDVFQRIGEAEAAIHGVDIEKIHFHEVGAMDSIIDIVGCCLALHKLGVNDVSIRNLPQGHGTIECAHGTYPNPAPATLRILEGFPVQDVDEPFELVTPTGAALISSWRTAQVPSIGSRAVKTAYSFGHRKLSGRPNLLRATLYESAADQTADEVLVLECNLDDTTPELVGCLFDQLLEAGALDVFTTPVQMKKQRPAILLTVLCLPSEREAMLDLVFAETTTFGIREYLSKRTVLERSFQTVETPYGAVRVKAGERKGRVVTTSPEMDDCRARAEEGRVSVREVYEAAKKEIK